MSSLIKDQAPLHSDSTSEFYLLLTLKILFLLGLAACVFAPELLLAQAQGAATDPNAQPPSIMEGIFKILPLFGIVFMIFYFLVLRPQEKQEREHQALLDSLKSGVWLLTSGGMLGKLVALEEQTVVLEISNGVKVKFEKSAIVKQVDSAIASPKGGSSAGKKKKTA